MKLHIPQVFVLDIELDNDFELYELEGTITANCPICSPVECIKTGHKAVKPNVWLEIISLKDALVRPNPIWTKTVSKDIWFQDCCQEVISTFQNMWKVWGLELFERNKNVFLARKDLGDGNYETGFTGREGMANIPPDYSFTEPCWIPEFKYAKLGAFW